MSGVGRASRVGDRVKVGFRDDEGDVEMLHASRVGDNRYKLEDVPFFQYGISWFDIVEAIVEGDGEPMFQRVVKKSGHRTVRVLLEEEREESDPFFSAMEKLGCRIHRATPRFIAIDVPPASNLEAIARHLLGSGVDWESADPMMAEDEETGH
jgi:hypothetical protein